MRIKLILPLLVAATVIFAWGCKHCCVIGDQVVAEGIIYSLEYKDNGRIAGITRLNDRRAVPGGNGSWNVDAYGRLTRDYLIITRPQRKDLGERVIRADRIIDIQFGDGGIKHVDENQPAK